MTHMPGKLVQFEEPDDWKPCSTYSDGTPRKCLSCKSLNIKWRIHSSSCGSFEDEEIKCFDCGFIRWIDGIDS